MVQCRASLLHVTSTSITSKKNGTRKASRRFISPFAGSAHGRSAWPPLSTKSLVRLLTVPHRLAGRPSAMATTATADSQISALRTKLATASQTILKLEREATAAEGTIRDLQSQLAAARAAAARPAPAPPPPPPPPPPPAESPRVAELERELQAERHRREEVQEELRRLQQAKQEPRSPPKKAAEPHPANAQLNEQLRAARKEVDRLGAALAEERARSGGLQRRLEDSSRASTQSAQQDSHTNLERDSELARLRRELQAQASQASQAAEPDPRLKSLDLRLSKLETKKQQAAERLAPRASCTARPRRPPPAPPALAPPRRGPSPLPRSRCRCRSRCTASSVGT